VRRNHHLGTERAARHARFFFHFWYDVRCRFRAVTFGLWNPLRRAHGGGVRQLFPRPHARENRVGAASWGSGTWHAGSRSSRFTGGQRAGALALEFGAECCCGCCQFPRVSDAGHSVGPSERPFLPRSILSDVGHRTLFQFCSLIITHFPGASPLAQTDAASGEALRSPRIHDRSFVWAVRVFLSLRRHLHGCILRSVTGQRGPTLPVHCLDGFA